MYREIGFSTSRARMPHHATSFETPGTGSGVGPPVLASVSQTAGTIDGGTSLALTGASFVSPMTSALGSVLVGSPTNATLTTSAHAAGVLAWHLTTVNGSSSPDQSYTYLAHPVFASIVPDVGPTAATSPVTITCSNLPPAGSNCPVTVTVGGSPCTSVVVTSGNTLTCVVPTGTAGPKNVVVTVDGVPSTGGNGAWTYYASLGFDLDVVPVLGQSLAVGGGSTPSSLVQVGTNAKLGDSLTGSIGWYWGGGYAAAVGQKVFPVSPATGLYYTITNAGSGTMSGTQPAWPVVIGNTVTDANGVVFQATAASPVPFDTSNPTSATLSLVPLVAPTRPVQGVNQANAYPTNILGESTGIGCANQLYVDTLSELVLVDVGIGGVGIVDIGPGGSTNAWAALTYELQALAHLASVAAKTIGAPFARMENGEADEFSLTYATVALTLAASLKTLVQGITGQVAPIPIALGQCSTSPVNTQGLPLSALQQLWLAQYNEYLYFLAGPKWPYPYTQPSQHLTAPGYVAQGEKVAEAALVQLAGGFWRPLAPNATALTTSTRITVTMDVPFPPLVFNTAIGQPHQSGPLSGPCSAGKGFEVIQAIANIVSATNASPIVLGTDAAHGLSTGDVINTDGVFGNAAANSSVHGGNFTVTVVDTTHVSLNGTTGTGTYLGGGQIRNAITAATNASPIACTTSKPHGLSTNDVVGIYNGVGNTAMNGSFVVTVTGASTFTLNGSTGNGAYTGSAGFHKYVPITAISLPSATTVQIDLASAVSTGVSVAAALTPDNQTTFSTNLPAMRCANLYDSDPWLGRSGQAQPNACCTFLTPVPFHLSAILSVTPNKVAATLAAPQALTIKGTRGFAGASGASVNGVALTGLVVVDDQTITGNIPAGTYTPGTGNVVVTGAAGAPTSLVNGFQFLPNDPSLIFVGQLQFWGEGDSVQHTAGVATAWNDKGPLGQNVPAVGSPVWNASASTPIAATPSVNMSAGNYFDTAAATFNWLAAGQPITLIALSKVASTGPAELVATGQTTAVELRISNTSTTKPEIVTNATPSVATWTAGGSVLNVWHCFLGSTTGGTGAGSAQITYDGQTPVTVATTSGNSLHATSTFTISARHGGSVSCSQESVMVIAVSGYATAQQIADLKTYTLNKWGV